jgi:hypothetical protein
MHRVVKPILTMTRVMGDDLDCLPYDSREYLESEMSNLVSRQKRELGILRLTAY